ncbi:EVE domain-containing protein [Bradyrhizobium sp. U87765 SZCCT0131]|uniref:EVE domain-containing protein n=1 Tax=unclassified Bradyrhizobium TaxID=2631580 RepID=UPI001BAD6972|nr:MULTISPECIES: EVE domain-containing protein [unclassified Bradyrhizobium]MBR1216709.1 EVE domain-containing protein [Bradyrhizobium sp. U87765 SZCCT0131]MBR1259535.1 EVE domain-containing protein [Bradyrhizobium sp. U87765 SZCCT0134]MBR1305676.1 EVE domain-containing protein [Bradyrhizobium sp. U87765 SZCCT0110]MBR1322043.1 EVE domain-containing protein [Bradyrhizobium sp. U87765 SZCCT0109]MBR1350679.1 EVE domain-containing protein [Bradyrhizobium sp. U87765 SZCCT0048]
MSAWLGVVSRAHVRRGVAGGFAQLCHGNAQPLRRMRTGDWLVYYSPSEERGGPPLRAFTAVGQVADDDVFAFDMGGGFVPFRRRIRYVDAMDAPIDSIRHHLALCAAPNWGVTLRRGHLPLAASDFALIAAAMRAAGTGMDTA